MFMTPVRLMIKRFREDAGLSQMELADKVGVRQATISDIETGKAKTVRLSLLEALADALGKDAAELIDHQPKASKAMKKRGR
jgi:transcriptional regulator with XRE-family HTH domain